MKKINYFLFLIFSVFSFPAFAQYTNAVSADYKNEEYQANGSAFSSIGADKAYTGNGGAYTGYSGTGVTVAVVDGGTLLSHPDLKDQISTLEQEGFNVYASRHGTHVAGIVGGSKNNMGMHGVAYNADLLLYSTVLDGGCQDLDLCMDIGAAWYSLSSSEFDSVKIVNNSWNISEENLTEAAWNTILEITDLMVSKNKLIVASAGNQTSLDPDIFPSGIGAYEPSFKNNIISVVAYNPDKLPSDYDFIASYSNLAGSAKEWTIAAPGTNIYSSILYEETDPDAPQFGYSSGTSMAAPMVSGTAALVQEAFPYLTGKQLADVIFSTAFKKEDLSLNPFMIQSDGGITRVLFFTDNDQGITFEQAKQTAALMGYSCGGNISCHEVTFEDVFGQGLLNAGDAVKGLKYFDASRLLASDYNSSLQQYLYSVDTAGYDSVWSHNIGQMKATSGAYTQANVGLKKTGQGVLTLSGANTFLGSSVVQGGELKLTGSLVSDVIVNGGTFSIADTAQMNGQVKVNAGGSFRMDSGSLNNKLQNEGKTTAISGRFNADITNTGTFSVAGLNDQTGITAGNVVSSGTFLNQNLVQFEEKGVFQGNLDNQGKISVIGNSRMTGQINNTSSGNISVDAGVVFDNVSAPIDNAGTLSGFGTIAGTVNNTGSVETSLTIKDLNSSGNIVMVASETGNGTATMQVDTLNITGGSFSVADGNISYDQGQRYTLIKFNNLTAFDNFDSHFMLSDFVSATASQGSNSIDVTVDYLRMSETGAVSTFLPEEKQVAGLIDKMYLDNNISDFKGYYYLSGDELKKEVNTLRSKVTPISKDQLPLTNTMSSQISSHLFKVNMNRDAGVFRQQYVPMQRYRGGYYRGRSGGDSLKTDQKIWAQFLGGTVIEDGDTSLNKGDIRTKTIGGMFGYDHELSENHLIGFTAGFATAKLKQDSDEIRLKDYRAGIYTGSRFGRFTLNTSLMGGFQQYDTSRYTQIMGLSSEGKAEFNGYSAELDLNLGFDFMRLPYRDYSFYLRSYLEANVNYISQDAYEETGTSSMLLGVNSVDNTSVSIQPGISIGYTFARTVLTADVGYQRILSGESIQSSAYFLADAAKETFDSLSSWQDKDFLNAGIGLKTNLNRNVMLNLWTGTRISKHTNAVNFSASISYAF